MNSAPSGVSIHLIMIFKKNIGVICLLQCLIIIILCGQFLNELNFSSDFLGKIKPDKYEPGKVKNTNVLDDKPEKAVNSYLNGIDVSHYQGKIDWMEVQKSGVSFAYIKATEGTNYTDPRLISNYQTIKKTDLLFAMYHFFEPTRDSEEQAHHFLAKTRDMKTLLPPVLDIEVSHGQSKKDIVNGAKKWLSIVEKETGCQPLIYTNKSYLTRYLGSNFREYSLWISEYSGKLKLNKGTSWSFWQHTQKAKIGGIDGNLDSNYFNGNITDLKKLTCNMGLVKNKTET